MKLVKTVGTWLCASLMLTGCVGGKAGTSGETEWIPKDITPATVTVTGQEEIVPDTEKDNREEATYTLKHTIAEGESLFCSLQELKQVTGEDTKGQEKTDKLHRNTFYMDNNGLLCIGMEVLFDVAQNSCTLKKQYYLPDKSVFTEQETLTMEEKWKAKEEEQYFDITFLSELFSWKYTVQEDNSVFIKDPQITLEKTESTVYEPVVVEVEVGHCWTTSGKMVEAVLSGEDYKEHFSCTTPESYVPVEPGEKLRFNYYCCWIPDIASILFLDDNDKVVQVYSYNTSNTLEDYIMTVPANATKMHLSFFRNQDYSIDRVRSVQGADLSKVTEEWYEEQCETILKENQKRSWQATTRKKLDKAYVTFVLDDCRPDMDRVADLFEEENTPLCIGAIWELFYYPASEGEESRLQVCERVVKNGGEILAHDRVALTEKLLADFPTKYKHFYKDKKYLQAYGFDVQGIILAGGEGQVVGAEESDAWVRTYFDYSDLYGMEEKGEPYYHKRIWLINCKDNYQEVIQEAIEQKQWVSFFFHEFSEVEEDKMREILQYIESISKEELEVTNYRTVYQKFYQ